MTAEPKPVDEHIEALAFVDRDGAAHDAVAKHVVNDRRASLQLLPIGILQRLSTVVHEQRHKRTATVATVATVGAPPPAGGADRTDYR